MRGRIPGGSSEGSLVAEAYGTTEISERHRHRFEVNNDYRDKVAESGLSSRGPRRTDIWWSSSSTTTSTRSSSPLRPIRYKSRPTRPHPLFAAFIKASLDYENEMRLPVEPWRENQQDSACRDRRGGFGGRRELNHVAIRCPGAHDYQTVASREIFDGRIVGCASTP